MSRSRRFPTLRVRGAVEQVLVVLGDQLDPQSAALDRLDPERDAVLLLEVAEEATHVPSHKQRTALFLAAMRHYALELTQKGFRVHYVELDDGDNEQSFDREVRRFVREYDPQRVLCVHPGEWRVMQVVEQWQRTLDCEVCILSDEHFYCPPEEFADWAAGRRQLVLETFYRHMRKQHGVLLTQSGEPVGGRWNFDQENRETFKRPPEVPGAYAAQPDEITQDVLDLVNERFPDAPGQLDSFHWPVTRAEARRALRRFIDRRLAKFGPFQDAMWRDEPILYHSALSSSLNLKLLNPREVVAAAIEAYEAGGAPLNSVEGFVRQILGWREFIRGVYWHEGPGYRQRNALRQRGDLPAFYWGWNETDMNCLRDCLKQVVTQGYGHHIQRLMVTGNFALISGVAPERISDWYLAMYVDAVDWVTLPNTLGMVMHADGGVVGTKPYAASANYIHRMSNYCDGCRYDRKARTGAAACPFNVFYWDFLLRNAERLQDNHRMKLALKNLERISPDEQNEIRKLANDLRRQLGITARRAG